MSKTIVICGYGPGISSAVAKRFGREGFQVALLARNEERLADGAASLEAGGIRAAAFPADLSRETDIEEAFQAVRTKLGDIAVLHWNAYATGAGDLLAVDAAATRAIFDVPVVGLLAAVKAALPDLERAKDGALLVTNGGFGLNDPVIDERADSRSRDGRRRVLRSLRVAQRAQPQRALSAVAVRGRGALGPH